MPKRMIKEEMYIEIKYCSQQTGVIWIISDNSCFWICMVL